MMRTNQLKRGRENAPSDQDERRRNTAVPRGKRYAFIEHEFAKPDRDHEKVREENLTIFTGETGTMSFQVAIPKIMSRFGAKNNTGIVTGNETFNRVPPDHQALVTDAMLDFHFDVDEQIRESCRVALEKKGIHNFPVANIPLNNVWPNFQHVPYQLTLANKNSLMDDLRKFEAERRADRKRLAIEERKLESDFHHRFESYERALKEWNERINQCIQTWREALGDNVLKQVDYEMTVLRNMTLVFQRLNELYNVDGEGDRTTAIMNKLNSMRYEPSVISFLGFLKDFDDTIELLPEPRPALPAIFYYLEQAIVRGGFDGLQAEFKKIRQEKMQYPRARVLLIEEMRVIQERMKKEDHYHAFLSEEIPSDPPTQEHSANYTSTRDYSNVKCYNCNKFGHFASKCPLPQKRRDKTKPDYTRYRSDDESVGSRGSHASRGSNRSNGSHRSSKSDQSFKRYQNKKFKKRDDTPDNLPSLWRQRVQEENNKKKHKVQFQGKEYAKMMRELAVNGDVEDDEARERRARPDDVKAKIEVYLKLMTENAAKSMTSEKVGENTF
jgi:hypothetical protein